MVAQAVDFRRDMAVRTLVNRLYNCDPRGLDDLISPAGEHRLSEAQVVYVEILRNCLISRTNEVDNRNWLAGFVIVVDPAWIPRFQMFHRLAGNEVAPLGGQLFQLMLEELRKREGRMWEYLMFAKDTHDALRRGAPSSLVANINILLSV